MCRATRALVLLLLVSASVVSIACAATSRAAESEPLPLLPPALAQALAGHETGDLIPAGDASFQLQLSRVTPPRFIVRMQAPRAAVEPKVAAYFRNLGVGDLATVNLMWCESTKRGDQLIWSCSR